MRLLRIIDNLITVIFISLIIVIFSCFVGKIIINIDKYDDFNDVILYIVFFFSDDTEYSKGFSEERFKEIKLGMSKDEVLSIIGPPLKILETGKKGSQIIGERYLEIFYYTKGPYTWSSIWFRSVVFNENRIVIKVSRHYKPD